MHVFNLFDQTPCSVLCFSAKFKKTTDKYSLLREAGWQVCLLKSYTNNLVVLLMVQFNNAYLHFRVRCCYTDRVRQFSSSSSSHSSSARRKKTAQNSESNSSFGRKLDATICFSLCVLSWVLVLLTLLKPLKLCCARNLF